MGQHLANLLRQSSATSTMMESLRFLQAPTTQGRAMRQETCGSTRSRKVESGRGQHLLLVLLHTLTCLEALWLQERACSSGQAKSTRQRQQSLAQCLSLGLLYLEMTMVCTTSCSPAPRTPTTWTMTSR